MLGIARQRGQSQRQNQCLLRDGVSVGRCTFDQALIYRQSGRHPNHRKHKISSGRSIPDRERERLFTRAKPADEKARCVQMAGSLRSVQATSERVYRRQNTNRRRTGPSSPTGAITILTTWFLPVFAGMGGMAGLHASKVILPAWKLVGRNHPLIRGNPESHASMPACQHFYLNYLSKWGGGIYSYPASQEGKNTMDKPQDFRYWWQSPDIEPIKKRATESDYCCCGQRIMHSRTGRPREFCSNRCKQRAYRIREALRKLRISGGLVT